MTTPEAGQTVHLLSRYGVLRVLWDMHRNIDHAAVPDERTVIPFSLPDIPASGRHWWL